jgi:hypothetical protein
MHSTQISVGHGLLGISIWSSTAATPMSLWSRAVVVGDILDTVGIGHVALRRRRSQRGAEPGTVRCGIAMGKEREAEL